MDIGVEELPRSKGRGRVVPERSGCRKGRVVQAVRGNRCSGGRVGIISQEIGRKREEKFIVVVRK